MTKLTVVLLPSQNPQENKRIKTVVAQALQQVPHRIVTDLSQCIFPCKLLFAFSLGADGINLAYFKLLSQLRGQGLLLKGCMAGMLIETDGVFYGKSTATQLAFTLNQAGCAMVGKALVEVSGTLCNFPQDNFFLLGESHSEPLPLMLDYVTAVKQLADRILGPGFRGKSPLTGRSERPKLVGIQAKEDIACNAYELWEEVSLRLEPFLDCQEITLQTESITHRNAYKLEEADALLMICPVTQNSIHPLQQALITQLSSQYSQINFEEKALYAVIVSGESGADLPASALLSSLSLDQGFYLPPRFAMIETARNPMEALALPEIELRLDRFAHGILETLSLGLLV